MTDPTNTPPAEPSAEAIEALRALEAKATPGPWTRGDYDEAITSPSGGVFDRGTGLIAQQEADEAFVCALRNAAPALLATVEAQRAYRIETDSLLDQAAGVQQKLEAERDALKEQLDRLAKDLYAENVAASELRVERDALKAEVERLLQAIEKTTADGLNLIGEVGAASTRASRAEAEVERLRAAYSDKVLEALKLRAVLAEARNMLTIGEPKCDRAARAIAAALRGEEASRE